MMIRLCEDKQGYKWAIIGDCESGIIVGPPTGLDKDLHNLVVEHGYYNVHDLKGQRSKLLRLVENNKTVLNTIYHVFQTEWWRK